MDLFINLNIIICFNDLFRKNMKVGKSSKENIDSMDNNISTKITRKWTGRKVPHRLHIDGT